MTVVVRHLGFPGWTSSQLLENQNGSDGGLCNVIQGIQNPTLSMVILLAGTNDLAYETNANTIVESIWGLHQLCHEQGVPHTLAIGIPPSAYQDRISSDAKALANCVNEKLQQLCHDHATKSTYMAFPFPYADDQTEEEDNGGAGDNWSPDGLHLSEQGYRVLGQSLAPVVANILTTIPSITSSGDDIVGKE